MSITDKLREAKRQYEAPGQHIMNANLSFTVTGEAAQKLSRIMKIGELAGLQDHDVMHSLLTHGILSMEKLSGIDNPEQIAEFQSKAKGVMQNMGLPQDFINNGFDETKDIFGYVQLLAMLIRTTNPI